MNNIFFTSDSHYGHKNIVKSLSDWSDTSNCRDFSSIEEMNEELVNGINSVVRKSDTLWHLGDFNFGGLANLYVFRKRIHCDNVHLILGNHDFKHGTIDPASVDHGFKSTSDAKRIHVGGQIIILNHYAQRVWNFQKDGAWHLYGHSHGTLKRIGNFSHDVGVEGTGVFNPVPYELSDLREFFKNDKIFTEDGHGRAKE